jgi:hypothetical protein
VPSVKPSPGPNARAEILQILKSLLTGEVESCETKNGNDIIKTVSGEPPAEEVYHYATAGVVGNGSFGVVFQATCLETSETVRAPLAMWVALNPGLKAQLPDQINMAASPPVCQAALVANISAASCKQRRTRQTCGSLYLPASHALKHASDASARVCRWPSRRCCKTKDSRIESCKSSA